MWGDMFIKMRGNMFITWGCHSYWYAEVVWRGVLFVLVAPPTEQQKCPSLTRPYPKLANVRAGRLFHLERKSSSNERKHSCLHPPPTVRSSRAVSRKLFVAQQQSFKAPMGRANIAPTCDIDQNNRAAPNLLQGTVAGFRLCEIVFLLRLGDTCFERFYFLGQLRQCCCEVFFLHAP